MQPIQNHNSNQKMKDRNKLPQFIVDSIETNRTSLMKEPVICPDEQLLKLMNARFTAVCSNFNDNILAHAPTEVFNKLGRLIQICQAKERNIRPQLEKFCYNTIVELFDIPEDCITLSLSIDESISPDKSFQVSPKTGSNEEPYREYADIENDSKEIQKRRILNIMVTGAAMDLTNRGLKKILSEVFDLDEELPHLYSKILKINEYLNFVSNIKISDRNPQQAGYENLTLGTTASIPKIDAHGLIFPILLQEAIRGLLELCVSNGLPDDEKIALKVIDKADALMYSVWDERIGPEIWNYVCKSASSNIDTKIIPSMLSNISTLPVDDFIGYARETFCRTEKGKRMNAILYDETKHEKDYDDFEGRLMQKQSDADVIEDEYFLEDEL